MPSEYVQITRDNIRRRGEEFDDIGRLISEQMYSDRSHFIYELLQNAEDALRRRHYDDPQNTLPNNIRFTLFEDRLEFRHFGKPFTEDDVKGISDVLKGTKSGDITQIGKFGIGFKSVYAFTSTPEIHSGEEHFIIERYIRPKATEPCPHMEEGETLFIFPFNHPELSREKALNLISDKMRQLGPSVLLFLNHISEIEWSLNPSGETGQYVKETKKRGEAREVVVIGQNNDDEQSETWLLFDRPVAVPDNYEGYLKSVPVEIGFQLAQKDEDNEEEIVKIKNSHLVAFFPTEKETRLGFLIQGPYKTTPARDNIPKADDWNETLVDETARLVVDALNKLKDMGLLTISLYEALPIRPDDFPEDGMFYPIFKQVSEALQSNDLLPTDDGSYISAHKALLASAEWLRKLLHDEQLTALYEAEYKWIHGEIRERGRYGDFWKYIRQELGIEEVTPDSFARKLTRSFLESQTDDWLIEFYSFLSGQEALWRAPRWSGASGGLLRAKPIVRLEDNSQVVPFRADGTTPNVFMPPPENTDFPIVKRSIAGNEKAEHFLKQLRLSEPDVFDDIVEKVLPKYSKGNVSSISEQEHAADIKKILRALTSDSEGGKKKVLQAARQTSFLKAVNQSSVTAYKRPRNIYLRSDELTFYFDESSDIWFLDESEGESEWLALGVATKPRFIKVDADLPWEEKDRLRGNQGHTRDIETIDYDLEGLNNFLSRMPKDGQQLIPHSLIIWDFLLEHLKESSYYQFYEGKYEWKYYHRRTVYFTATWKKQLRNHSWMPKNGNDSPFKPSEVSLSDLPDQFNRNH